MKNSLLFSSFLIASLGTFLNSSSTMAGEAGCEAQSHVTISGTAPTSGITLLSPTQNETVPTLYPGQKAYLALPRAERVKAFADEKYRAEMKALGYYPMPTSLVWTNTASTLADVQYTVTVTCDFNGKNVAEISIPATNALMTVSVDNLEIARSYTWNVSDGKNSVTGKFKTEDIAPRLIRIPGVPNVRDIGGRIGLNGLRVKQGMVIRTAGLNNNASETFFTKEELIAKDPSLKEREESFIPELTKWQELEAKTNALKIVSAPLSTEWMLFFPEKARLESEGLASLRDIDIVPAEFLGFKGEILVAKDGESINIETNYSRHFPPTTDMAERNLHPAVLMQVVEAADDGYMSMSAGGDYYWYLCVNGEKVFDLETAGNWRSPYNADSYGMPVPVKKGKNLITVIVKTGAGGWTWGCKSAPAIPVTKLIHDKVRSIQRTQEAVYPRVSKGKVKGTTRLTPETQNYMTKTLGIKSDIDLRSDQECWGMEGSPMGKEVTWFHYSSGAYGGMQKEYGRNAFKNVFNVFLDEKNYPIDFHCIAGQDRTGAVAFIINGLLGVEEEQLYLDWESTGFWNGNTKFNHERLFDNLVKGFEKWPGKTLNEKIEAYVLDLGFTKADIENLRGIMLE